MRCRIFLLMFMAFVCGTQGQTIRFSGNTLDTTGQEPLPNALMMTLRLNDSSLVGFSRSGSKGQFGSYVARRDTYIVVISHPHYSDKTYLLVPSENDTVFNFKNVKLPPKSVAIKEVEVIAYREKSYYKGDTLIFTADSFKTKADATVEDLLKRLPGFRVDANGKITVQGKEVDQVLVDGDEFFGTDPTVATRNLAATTIKNVQVYDKKNETAEEGKEETVKVINLQMKEDAKRGYFGKVSGATDFTDFYENELLANRFKGNRKISVFGLMANTPKQAFNWNDVHRYGLTGEEQWSMDEETGEWNNNMDQRKGVPQTIRAGAYFNDKFGKNTKLNGDYTFSENRLFTETQTNTQYFFDDTTSTNFSNRTVNNTDGLTRNHGLNVKLITKFDSLTELTLQPKVRINTMKSDKHQADNFLSEENVLTRSTDQLNSTESETRDMNTVIRVKRSFMKKDRAVTLTYQPILVTYKANTRLNTTYRYYTSSLADSVLSQKRDQDNSKTEQNAGLLYVEPWTKKFKTELNYNFGHTRNTTNRSTYDLQPAGTDIFNPILSNNFDNFRIINRAGTKLIYDVKKFRITGGVQVRNITQVNKNLTRDTALNMSVNNVLPNASFVYRFNQGSQFQLYYNSQSRLPDLQQMQPVLDVTDPNRISRGNPNLKPTFNNNVNLNYWFYKGISDINFWSGANFNNTINQISNTTFFDSLGRAITAPININGNYHVGTWFGGGFPVFKRFMKVYLSANANHNNNVSVVNSQNTISQNTSVGPSVTLEKNSEKFEVRMEGNYNYNVPRNNLSIQSQQPYYSYKVSGNLEIKFTKKFSVNSDWEYNNNGNRTPGYNLNYFIVNGAVNYAFLKSNNLVVSLMGNDLLNQNISNERWVTSNQITDTKTQIIKRYFLLRVLYKFNSQQAQADIYED